MTTLDRYPPKSAYTPPDAPTKKTKGSKMELASEPESKTITHVRDEAAGRGAPDLDN